MNIWIHLFCTFSLWDCPNLESLPEGISALTSLQTLDIRLCPMLLKRCKKQIGEDWHKISHIPNLEGELSRQEEERGMWKSPFYSQPSIKKNPNAQFFFSIVLSQRLYFLVIKFQKKKNQVKKFQTKKKQRKLLIRIGT